MASTDKTKAEKKRIRVSSSTSAEGHEADEEHVAIASLLERIKVIEQQAVKREGRIAQLEAQLTEAKLEIKQLKSSASDLQRSLKFTQKEQAEANERLAECEQEQAQQGDELIRQELYSRRWNMLFYKIPERSDEDCTTVVQNVLVNDLKIDREEVKQFKFCGVHRLGKQSRGRSRPIIARFTSRSDRDKVWKFHYNLKGSNVSIGKDLPKRVQEIRKKILVPAMKKVRNINPRNRASVIRDKLFVNGKYYLHHNIPKRWLSTEPLADSFNNKLAEDVAETSE